MTKHHVEFGNLICKFGDYNLLDKFSEIFRPAFDSADVIVAHGKEFLIRNIKFDLAYERPYMSFQLIKNETFVFEQTLSKSEELVRKHSALRHAPSSLVVISLADHRIIVCPEVRHGPTLNTLTSVVRAVVKPALADYIDNSVGAVERKNKKETRKQLKQDLKLLVKIHQFTAEASIDDKLQKFAKIRSVEFKVTKPNQDYDSEALYKSLQTKCSTLDAQSSKLEFHNKHGLDPAASKEEVKAAARGGNTTFVVRGTTGNGEDYTVDNASVKTRVHIEDEPEPIPLVRILTNKELRGEVPVSPEYASGVNRIRAL